MAQDWACGRLEVSRIAQERDLLAHLDFRTTVKSWPPSWRAPSTSTAPKPCEHSAPTGVPIPRGSRCWTGGSPRGSQPTKLQQDSPGQALGRVGVCPVRALGRQQPAEDSADTGNYTLERWDLCSLLLRGGVGEWAAPPGSPFPVGFVKLLQEPPARSISLGE